MAGSSTMIGLEVLRELTQKGESGVRGLMPGLCYSRATLYRVLDDLEESGWIVSFGNPKRFTPSLRVAQLGLQALGRWKERRVLLPAAINVARQLVRPVSVAFHES